MRLRPAVVAAVLLVGSTGAVASAAVGQSNSNVQVSVSGRVTSDTGQGVGGMCVYLAYQDRYLTIFKQVTSQLDGSYRITFQQAKNTTYDSWTVYARAACGADRHWQATRYPKLVATSSYPGKTNMSGIDMQTLPGGRILGRVTDSATGKPVSGLFIYAYSDKAVDYVWTQSDGTYAIGGFPDGDYVLWLNPIFPGVEPLTREYLSQWAPAQPTVQTADRYHITVGQDTVVDVSAEASDTIAGLVTGGPTGQPLKNTEVEVTSEGGPWQTDRTVTTDKNGYYVANGLGPGSYKVCFVDTSGLRADRCYRNKTTNDSPTLVTVDGFRVVVHGINQRLPIGPASHLQG